VWPASGKPVARFSFGRFKESGSSGKQHSYSIDVTAENLWDKKISKADFSLYLFDKDKIRIGEGWISISDVAPGQISEISDLCSGIRHPGINGTRSSLTSFGIAVVSASEDDFCDSELCTTGSHTKSRWH